MHFVHTSQTPSIQLEATVPAICKQLLPFTAGQLHTFVITLRNWISPCIQKRMGQKKDDTKQRLRYRRVTHNIIHSLYRLNLYTNMPSVIAIDNRENILWRWNLSLSVPWAIKLTHTRHTHVYIDVQLCTTHIHNEYLTFICIVIRYQWHDDVHVR